MSVAAYDFTVTMKGVAWRIKTPGGFLGGWPPLLAASTTAGHTTVFDVGLAPDAISLAHEAYHTRSTSWFRYLLSCTIGILWGDGYWRQEERNANLAGLAGANDPDFVALAARLRAMVPAGWLTVTINHPV